MLQIVREQPLRIILTETSSSRRGFLFYLSAGFSGPLDPLTGMVINLTTIEAWFETLKESLQQKTFSSLFEVMTEVRGELNRQAATVGAVLQQLTFREHRGWQFFWQRSQSFEHMTFCYSHYLESLPRSGQFDLLKINFYWEVQSNCVADLQYEGFKVLKEIEPSSAHSLQSSLLDKVGLRLRTGSYLKSIRIDNLSEGFGLEIP